MLTHLRVMGEHFRQHEEPVPHLHEVLGLEKHDEGLCELEVPLERDVAVVLVVEILLLVSRARTGATHHGDEAGGLGTLLGRGRGEGGEREGGLWL